MFWIYTLLGCQDKAVDSSVDPIEPCTTCVFQDENNYSYSSALNIEQFSLKPESNIIFDWSNLTVDVQGHEVDPQSVEKLTLLAFLYLTPEEIQLNLANDTLLQADISLYVICTPEENTCALEDFGILGADLYVPEYFIADQAVWLTALQSSEIKGGFSFALLVPEAESTLTEVQFDNQTAALQADVDFHSLEPVYFPEGQADIIIDWRELDRDGLGNEIEPTKVDSVFVSKYSQSVQDLENNIFDLMTMGDEIWSMPLDTSGEASLQNLVGETEFTGIDDSHVWLLALECSSCLNPAPRFVTRLKVP